MNFKLTRFTHLWSFYHPRMMKYWIFGGGLLLFGYLGLVFNYKIGEMLGYSLFSSIISYVIFGAPLVFALGRERALELQIPANTAERAAVPFLFCYVVVPIGLGLLWEFFQCIGAAFGLPHDILKSAQTMFIKEDISLTPLINEFSGGNSLYWLSMGFMGNLLPLTAGLYAAIVARKNPIIMTVVGVIVGFVFLVFLSFGFGVYAALTDMDFINIIDQASDEVPDPGIIMFIVKSVLKFMALASIVLVCVMLPVMYRRIKRAQI